MCVEVKDCDGLIIGSLQGAESGEGNRVIATECDEFRVDMGGWIGVGERSAGEEFCVCFCHLAESEGIIEWCYWDIAAIKDQGPGCIRIDAGSCIEASKWKLAS